MLGEGLPPHLDLRRAAAARTLALLRPYFSVSWVAGTPASWSATTSAGTEASRRGQVSSAVAGSGIRPPTTTSSQRRHQPFRTHPGQIVFRVALHTPTAL